MAVMAKNIGFLVKTVPFASKRAEEHFNKSIEIFSEIGANGYLGIVYLSLGLLHKGTRRIEKARQSTLKAIEIFQECGAEVYLKRAKNVLDSLG